MDFTAIIKTVAPWIGTAIGGPFGGMAVKAIGDALGLAAPTIDTIKEAISGANPDQLLALKKADQDFQIQMKALGIKEIADLEAIAAGDRKSAREMQTANKSIVPALLTAGVGIAFALTLLALFKVEIPQTNRDIVVYMCGQLAAAFGACLAFWVGTTRQTENNTHFTNQILAQKNPS